MTCPDIKTLERQLRFISDLPRLHRKIQCGLITPQEITSLFQSYAACKVIMKITKNTLLECSTDFEKFRTRQILYSALIAIPSLLSSLLIGISPISALIFAILISICQHFFICRHHFIIVVDIFLMIL